MRVVLVGAPGSGKTELVEALRDRFMVVRDPTLKISSSYALGQLADYRVELLVAAQRAHLDPPRKKRQLCCHSLIDSLTYSAVRVANMVKYVNVDEQTLERWWLTAYMISALFLDTFTADHVFFLPGHDNTSWSEQIENTLRETLESIEIKYVQLTGVCAKDAESIATIGV